MSIPRLRRILIVAAFAIAAPTLAQNAGRKVLDYPPTKIENVTEILHGVAIEDPYRWLENGESPAVKAWVESQNAFTESILGKYPGWAPLRKRLGQLLEIGSLGTPVPVKGRYFYTKREGTQNQPNLYVRQGVNGEDKVLLDVNQLSKDGTTALDWWYPSKDGSLLAYGISENGSEQSTLHIRDVASGKDRPDIIGRTRYSSVAWLPDNKGFYYTRYPAKGSVAPDQENYNRHVYFHQLGTDPKNDLKVFGEGRPPEDMISVQISPCGRWLAAVVYQGWAKSEIFIRDNDSKEPKFQPLIEKVPAIFNVILRSDRFYVHTNQDAPRYRLFRVDPKNMQRERWVELIPQGKDKLETVVAVGDRLIAEYMHNAASKVQILKVDGKMVDELDLDTLGTVSGLGAEWDGKEIFYSFQSYTMPTRVYRRDLGGVRVVSELWGEVKTDIDPAAYEVKQVKYPSKDGTEITMFITHKKGLKKDGKTPTLLYGYGGFNISLTPTFSAVNMVFLEKGGILAIPNLRGGGEYGEEWHRAGMLDKKQNTFDDFLSAADWLLEQKYTDREHLAIMGRSNGGLLVGAALTQRPDLFKAVVCGVPLLDMLRYHKFLIARLWIPEYGSADDAAQFAWLRKYSPYQKVTKGTAYPAVLLTTAAADSRVDPLHARKMAARLQAATSSANPILLRQESRAGHGQGKPRGMVLDEQTDVWSFLFSQLGL